MQKQTHAGQRMRFKAFIVVGDNNGHVGLGVKCAKEVATAIRGAIVLAALYASPALLPSTLRRRRLLPASSCFDEVPTRRKDVHRGRIREEREHGRKGALTRSPYYPRSNVGIAGNATVALRPAKSVCKAGSGNTETA
jgi:hypothetical protein